MFITVELPNQVVARQTLAPCKLPGGQWRRVRANEICGFAGRHAGRLPGRNGAISGSGHERCAQNLRLGSRARGAHRHQPRQYRRALKVPGMTATWAGRIVRFRPYRTKQDLRRSRRSDQRSLRPHQGLRHRSPRQRMTAVPQSLMPLVPSVPQSLPLGTLFPDRRRSLCKPAFWAPPCRFSKLNSTLTKACFPRAASSRG